MANIYVTRSIPEAGLNMLREKFGEIEINPDDRVLSKEELIEKVKGRDAVVCLLTDTIDDEVLAAAGEQCKIFSNYAVGYNNIDVEAAAKRGIMVTNTPGVLTETTADMAIALMLSVARRIVEGDKFMREGKFKGWGPMLMLGQEVTGKTLGIIGAGRIGSDIGIKMGKAFGMKVLYLDRKVNEKLEKETDSQKVDLETLCKESDYISINLSYTPETHHLINEKMFGLMKENAILVNTARGPIVDEAALVNALREGKIFGAGLDVFENEPQMAPGLAELDNVVLAPHTGSATIETRSNMATIAAQNLIDALEGRTPKFLVNPEEV